MWFCGRRIQVVFEVIFGGTACCSPAGWCWPVARWLISSGICRRRRQGRLTRRSEQCQDAVMSESSLSQLSYQDFGKLRFLDFFPKTESYVEDHEGGLETGIGLACSEGYRIFTAFTS